jgi:hypothetical protein
MGSPSENNASMFRLAPNVLAASTPEEIVLLDYDRGKYSGIKGSARHVFALLRQGASLDDMVAELVRLCDVDEADARKDLTGLFDAMLAAGLVFRVDADT